MNEISMRGSKTYRMDVVNHQVEHSSLLPTGGAASLRLLMKLLDIWVQIYLHHAETSFISPFVCVFRLNSVQDDLFEKEDEMEEMLQVNKTALDMLLREWHLHIVQRSETFSFMTMTKFERLCFVRERLV